MNLQPLKPVVDCADEAKKAMEEILGRLEKRRWKNRSLSLSHGCRPLHKKDREFPRPGYRNCGFRHYGGGLRFIQYGAQPDARTAEKLFLALCETMPDYFTMALERESLDVNRERDCFFRPDTHRDWFLDFFHSYKHLWLEDGVMGLGVQTQDEGHEIFLDDHKTLVIFSKGERLEKMLGILKQFDLQEVQEERAVHDIWHKHVPFDAYLTEEEANRLLDLNVPLDGYEFCNELVYAGELEPSDDQPVAPPEGQEPQFTDKWRYKVVGETTDRQGFFKTFYLCAPDQGMAETLLDNWMSGEPRIENYFIYDYYNVDPSIIDPPEAKERMAMASLGICWASEIEYWPLDAV